MEGGAVAQIMMCYLHCFHSTSKLTTKAPETGRNGVETSLAQVKKLEAQLNQPKADTEIQLTNIRRQNHTVDVATETLPISSKAEV